MSHYKAFFWPLIDYEDTIDEKPQNKPFWENLQSVQYKVTLAITVDVQGTFREKIYQEFGLVSLKSRKWYERLSCMFKRMNNKAPNYIFNLIPKSQQSMTTRITTYQTTTAEQIVSSIFFSFHFKRLVQFKCFYKKLRVSCDIQKYTIILHSSSSEQRIQYIWSNRVEINDSFTFRLQSS